MTMSPKFDLEDDLSEEFLLQSISRRIRIIDDRLIEIEEEIKERERIGETIMRKLQARKEEYMGCLYDENALMSKAEGKDFFERRVNMLKKIERIDQEINKEMSQLWRDLQDLTKERRELKERKEELLAKRRSVEKLSKELSEKKEGGRRESKSGRGSDDVVE